MMGGITVLVLIMLLMGLSSLFPAFQPRKDYMFASSDEINDSFGNALMWLNQDGE